MTRPKGTNRGPDGLPPSPVRGSLAANLLLAAGSLLFALLLGEAALRGYHWWKESRAGGMEERLEKSRGRELSSGGEFTLSAMVRPSPWEDIVYELRPGISGTFLGKPFSVSSQGLRDREFPRGKGPGVFRVAGLGDSVMFGWGVAQDEFYLKLLERRLNGLPGEHPVYEVMNFAVPGYNTAVEAAVFERKALPFKPDLVVIHFINNDFGVPTFMQRPRDILSLRRSYLAEFVSARVAMWRGRDAIDLVANDFRNFEGDDREEIVDRYRYMVGPRGYERAMDRLAALTRPAGIPVIIILGSRTGEQEKVVGRVAKKHGFDILEIGPYSDAYVLKHGITNTPEARKKALWISMADHHPNAAGHTIYAEALEDRLRSLGVIK